jgi:hypothetical protein
MVKKKDTLALISAVFRSRRSRHMTGVTKLL